MADDERILLILDLDETLLFATEEKLDREPDGIVGPYHVYCRPDLEAFLRKCSQHFQLAVWTSATGDYADGVVRAVFPAGVEPLFLWHRAHCVRQFDSERHETCFIKDLKKLKRLGFNLERVLIVDDTPQKVQRNYGNAIYVTPYLGDPEDTELQRLAVYLESLRLISNVRNIEKRGWRNKSFPSQSTCTRRSNRGAEHVARLYTYVGPTEFLRRAAPVSASPAIESIGELRQELAKLGFLFQPGELLTLTFVIDVDGRLRIADRHREHVACAGGGCVRCAGEMTLGWEAGEVAIENVTNQSTGYCPDVESWDAVESALAALGIRHPGGLDPEFVFRRCESCGETNVVKDAWFICALCGAELPRHWNYA